MTLSELLKTTRQYFWNKKFTEVEPIYLNESLPLEPNLYSFETIWRNLGTKYYLPTSPEFVLKRYLSQNKNDCFSISHCFRDLENSGPQHHPEFLMLEWYEVNKNLADIKQSTINYISQFLDIEFVDLVLPTALPNNEPDFNQYFLNEIEPTIPKDKAVFVTGYPSFLSPLASSVETNEAASFRSTDRRADITRDASTSKMVASDVSKRFELYINGIEIANACVENRDPEQIKSAFIKESEYRKKNNLPLHPYSQIFLDNISQLPPCSGIGLGLERLLMILDNKSNI